MNLRRGLGSVAPLAIFAVLFTVLCVSSYTRESATWDEPHHVATGVLAWQGDHRIDPEHPPFLRLWAALPLTMMDGIKDQREMLDKISPEDWISVGQFQYSHAFMYLMNDADALLYRARFMVVLLGVLLGCLLFGWLREWLGFWPAVAALTLYCFEPNILANSAIVTTDLAVTCFIFGALYFLWRTTRRLSAGNMAGLTMFVVLAVVSKFSAIILAPIIVALLAIHVVRAGSWAGRTTLPAKAGVAGGIVVWLALISWLAVWGIYGFRFEPSATAGWFYHFQDDPSVVARTPGLARLVAWSDQHHLLPNAFSQGFLFGQAKGQVRGSFLAGTTSGSGWWYYFPYAFAIKTPIAVLALLVAGLTVIGRAWRRFLDTAVFLVLPIVVYLAVAMAQNLNIGLRHILPVYPFVIAIGGAAIAWLLGRSRRTIVAGVAVLVVLDAVEVGRTWPHTLSFFNSFVGGPANGHRYLVDSNLDWGQDLKGLKVWMVGHGVDNINLAYFGSADPAYYGITDTPLPGAPFFESDRIGSARLPGYVAVSATILSGAYGTDAERRFYEPIRNLKPVATIGYSINVYQIDRPWW